jgi:hypothetical protein
MTIIRWMRRTTTGRCRIWVKVRRTQYEYMSSALPSNSDITRRSRHFAFVPIPDSYTAANELRRIAAILLDGHFEAGQFY